MDSSTNDGTDNAAKNSSCSGSRFSFSINSNTSRRTAAWTASTMARASGSNLPRSEPKDGSRLLRRAGGNVPPNDRGMSMVSARSFASRSSEAEPQDSSVNSSAKSANSVPARYSLVSSTVNANSCGGITETSMGARVLRRSITRNSCVMMIRRRPGCRSAFSSSIADSPASCFAANASSTNKWEPGLAACSNCRRICARRSSATLSSSRGFDAARLVSPPTASNASCSSSLGRLIQLQLSAFGSWRFNQSRTAVLLPAPRGPLAITIGDPTARSSRISSRLRVTVLSMRPQPICITPQSLSTSDEPRYFPQTT